MMDRADHASLLTYYVYPVPNYSYEFIQAFLQCFSTGNPVILQTLFAMN